MPKVSDEWIEWLRTILIPQIHIFDTMTPDQALKQVAFAQGILWLKAKIKIAHEANRVKETRVNVMAPPMKE